MQLGYFFSLISFAISFIIFAPPLRALTLNEFIDKVQNKNEQFQSFEASKESSSYKRQSSDLPNALVLNAKVGQSDDKKPQSFGTMNLTRTQAKTASIGLAQKATTGTQWTMNLEATEATQDITLLSPATMNTSATQGIGSLSLGVSQSLWKDFFGKASQLRHDRELQVESLERGTFDLQEKKLLIEAETSYWDYLYIQEEWKQRKTSLDRAKKIESWVQHRVSNGIGDRSDTLGAEGLVAQRQLNLLSTEDEKIAVEKKIRDLLQLASSESTPHLEGDIHTSRNLHSLIPSLSLPLNVSTHFSTTTSSASSTSNIVRLDAYLQELETKAKKIGSLEVEEGIKPDLTLEGSYKTNGIEQNFQSSLSKATDTNTPTFGVAVKFTWLLDSEVKSSAISSARKEALASELKKQRSFLESESSWIELERRHRELSKKIKAMEQISKIQLDKAASERDKLSKGRSITSQVITAEQDASDAELTFIKMSVEQRKMEAQSRLFVKINSSSQITN